MRILALHPRNWADPKECTPPRGVQVRHVEIGGARPLRLSGKPSHDGIGQVAVDEGVKALYGVCREWRPEFLLFGIHPGFETRHIARCKSLSPGLRAVMHYTDQRPTVAKWVEHVRGQLDLLLVTNTDKSDWAKYADAGISKVRTFYDGVSPREYWPRPSTPKHDVFFGGNNFWLLNEQLTAMKRHPAPWLHKFTGAQLRHEFLCEVDKRFDLLIRGEWGWEGTDFYVKKALFHPRYLTALREARININTVNYHVDGLVTRRVFRNLACGTMYITERMDGLEAMFENYVHAAWFDEIEEGLDLIRYYLDHPCERERVAMQARAEILRAHTWQHRLCEFVGLLREVF